LNDDFRDLLSLLLETESRFLVVGAHALALHGVPRATGDLDVWVDREHDNPERVWSALVRFGAPVAALGISKGDLGTPNTVVQLGLPPNRIDVLTDITGMEFGVAWSGRVSSVIDGLELPFLSRAHLIANKRATGRLRDLADVEALEGVR
jgi:hypothetical protein